MFWSNNGTGNNVDIKTIEAVLDKDNEPTDYYIDMITTMGRIKWRYSSKQTRDEVLLELRRLRDEYRKTKK